MPSDVCFSIADYVPWTLICRDCDAGDGICCEADARAKGWNHIEFAPDLLQANFIGVCPDCEPQQ